LQRLLRRFQALRREEKPRKQALEAR